ncbi:Glutamine--tRNA ligase, cytoplasmic [Cardamine amara subsp. amara]|uniref:Glutamine--tRNA ligase, cytoplasmic n=1 Tax=Cardamine amara subsp. amara TaxID=228776 RepID=A0ABD1C5S9_CARAN
MLNWITVLSVLMNLKMKTPAQLDATYSIFGNAGPEDLKLNELDKACGAGVEVSPEDIEITVEEIFEDNMKKY